ncbi:MAG: prolyl oligopeptidase family serine peptidase [Aeoliella sp.]
MPSPAFTSEPPKTPVRPVEDVFHGQTVVDDYRWLEDSSDPEVQAWSNAQNAHARSVLDHLPNVEAIRARVTEIMSAKKVKYWSVEYHGGKYFAMKDDPPRQQAMLVVSDSCRDGAEPRILVDPNAMDESGATSIEWYKPSFDGSLMAVCLASGGDEVGDVKVIETATGNELNELVPRVNTGTAGGDLAWAANGSGFFYTRHPRGDERPAEDMNFYQQVYFHELGSPTAEDRYEIGKELPRIAEIQLTTDQRTGRVIATVQDGDGGEFAHFLRSTDGQWRQFSEFGDKIIQAEFGPRDDLFILSRQDAPRGKIVHTQIEALNAGGWETVVHEGPDTIVASFIGGGTLLATSDRLYVVYQLGGPSEVRVFDLSGKPMPAPDQSPVSSAGGLTPGERDSVILAMGSYVKSSARHVYDPLTNKTTPTLFRSEMSVSFNDIEVVREFATSKDGTQVPVNILYRKGLVRDGRNPCLATAYGGYGISLTPYANSLNRVLLDHGFVVAIANIRGGGEYGEKWHLEGNLTNKQNVFDDFAATLQHLADRGYTNSDHLVIEGGSNGGLLMGAILTQHPDLVKAVVSHVGIYDMLRVELSPNGEFNITEFGTVKNPEHFAALIAYSPLHNVRDNDTFPPVLFLTGANDPRVDPMQSRKMTARLQAANAEALLRTSADSGHGAGTPLDERIEQEVDVLAFVFDELGVSFSDAAPNQ